MSSSPSSARSPRSRWAHALVVACTAILLLAACTGEGDADPRDFDDLTSGDRVYDSGDSLTEAQVRDVSQQLEALRTRTGADVVVVVRELDADPEDTLDQVEALQQAWVAKTGIDQDVAGAILINREPGTDDEARAGIFLGSTFDDGNVPSGEQEDIVEDALVPPLRDGDVAGSLAAGIDRLGDSIVNGPPTNGLNDFADGPGSTWLPWVGLVIALLGLGALARLFGRRPRPTRPEMAPTRSRPDQDTGAPLAAALALGGAQASAVPAVVLDLAARDALVIEPEKEPSWGSQGTVQIRLLEASMVRDGVERVVWDQLVEQAEGDVVDSKGLGKVAADAGPLKNLLKDDLRARGWLDPGHGPAIVRATILGLIGSALLILSLVVIAGGAPLMLVAAVPAGALVLLAFFLAVSRSRLSVAGRDAARPWEAYREGMKQAGKDDTLELDLDAALPDIIAMNLGSNLQKRLDAATDGESASSLRAFTAPAGHASANAAIFPWAAFSGAFASSSGTGTVSGGGAGGGGGAAGGT